MIEEGITQAASLQVGATCSNIVTTIGHAYFSPNRLKSDISTYHSFIHPEEGSVYVPRGSGLGVELCEDKLNTYRTGRVVIQ